jgi:hypothetical protein
MKSKPSWQVRRTGIAQRDGSRRWDETYQLLLHWVVKTEGGGLSTLTHPLEEEPHGSGPICPRLNQSATAAADD